MRLECQAGTASLPWCNRVQVRGLRGSLVTALGNAIENAIWAVTFFIVGVGLCRLLPEFDGAVRVALVVAIIGIACFLAFLATVDVPMYLARWRAEVASGNRPVSALEGLRDAS